jgi:alpha-L-arabinofuranosidase
LPPRPPIAEVSKAPQTGAENLPTAWTGSPRNPFVIRADWTAFSVPTIGPYPGQEAGLPGLAGSASLHGKDIVLTVVNPHAKDDREAEIAVQGASVNSGRVRVLRADDIHAHNTFNAPRAVEPVDGVLRAGRPALVHRFPAPSVTRLNLQLA